MNADQKIPLKSESARQAFSRQLAEVKSKLPKDWKLKFILKYPEYDTYRGGVKLLNVYNDYSSDMTILEGMQIIAAEYQKEQQTAG
jgi:hypothetical protein